MNNDHCAVDTLGNLYVIVLDPSDGLVLRMYLPGSTEPFASTPLISSALSPHVMTDPLETDKIFIVYSRSGTGEFDVELQKTITRKFFVARYTRPQTPTTDWQPDEHFPVQYNFLGLEDGQFPKISLPRSGTSQTRREFLVGFVATDILEVFGESLAGAEPEIVQETTVTMKFLQYQIREDPDDNNVVKPLFETTIPTGLVITHPETFQVYTEGNEIIVAGVYEVPTAKVYIRAAKINGTTFSQTWVMQHNDRNNQQDGTIPKTNLRILKFGDFTFIGFNGNVGSYYLWKINNRGRLVWPLAIPGFSNPTPLSTSGMLGGTVQNIYMFQDNILVLFLGTGISPRKLTFRKISSETGAVLSFVESNLAENLIDIKAGSGNALVLSNFPWENARVIYRTNLETVKVATFNKPIVCPVGTEPFSDISQNQIVSTPDFKRTFTVHSDPSGVYVHSLTLNEDGTLDKEVLANPIPGSAGQRYPVIGYFNNVLYTLAVNVCLSFTDFMKMNVTRFTEGVLLGENVVYIRNRPEDFTESDIRSMFPTNFDGINIRNLIQEVELRAGLDEYDAVYFPSKTDAELAVQSIDKNVFGGARVRARIGDLNFVRNWTEERIVPDTQDVNFNPKIAAFTNRVLIFYTREDQTVNVDYINSSGAYLRTNSVQFSTTTNNVTQVTRMLTTRSQDLSVWITPVLSIVGVFSQNILIGSTMASDPNRYQVWRFNFGNFAFVSRVELDFGLPLQPKSQFEIRETALYDAEFYAIAKSPSNQILVSFVSIPEKSTGGRTYNVEFSVDSGLNNILSHRVLGMFDCFDNIVLFSADNITKKLVSSKITVSGAVFTQERTDVLGLDQLVESVDGKSSGCLLSFGDFTKYFLFGRIDPDLPPLSSQQRFTLTSSSSSATYAVTYNEIETIFLQSSLVETSEYQTVFDDFVNRYYVVGRMNPSERITENNLVEAVRGFTNFIIDLDKTNAPLGNNIFPKGTATSNVIRTEIEERFSSFGLEFVADLVDMFNFMLNQSSDTPSLRSINMIDFIINNFSIPFASFNLVENDDNNFTIRVPPADYDEEYFVQLLENRMNKISTRTYSINYTAGSPPRWSYQRPRRQRTPVVTDEIRDMAPGTTLAQVVDNLRSLSLPQILSEHPFDLERYVGVTEDENLTIDYSPEISFSVNWTDLGLLNSSLETLFGSNPSLTTSERNNIERFAREEIRLRRMRFLADEVKMHLNGMLLPEIDPSFTFSRVYSYEVDQDNELQWSYLIPSRNFPTPRTTDYILNTELAFPDKDNFISVVLERFRLKLNSDILITQSIFDYRFENVEPSPGFKWYVRERIGAASGSETTLNAIWNISSNQETTVANKLEILRNIINSSTGNVYNYSPTNPSNSSVLVTWNGPGFSNVTTDSLLVNAPYRNRSRELALLDIRNNVLTGIVNPDGTVPIYNYILQDLIGGVLRWEISLFPVDEVFVGTIDNLIDNNLDSNGRNIFMTFIKDVMDEMTGRVFSRVASTSTWEFNIPPSRVFESGNMEATISSLPLNLQVTYDLDGNSETTNLWDFFRNRLDQTSPLRVHNFYDFDEKVFDSVVPLYRRWYYETIDQFVPENTRFLFAGPDPLSLEKALGIPEKILNLNGNYSVSFNRLESLTDVPTDYSGISETVLSMELIEDFGPPIPIHVSKQVNRDEFLFELIAQLNNFSSNKIYSGSFANDRLTMTFLDNIPVEDQVPGRTPTGSGAVAFKFTLDSPMGTALGFPTSNPNELVYSFNIFESSTPLDISGLGEQIPQQEPVGMYLKAFDKDGFQVLTRTSEGFDPLQLLLDAQGQNACICQDADNVYVCYIVARKTLSAFVTFHVKRFFKSSFLLVWEEQFVLPDANVDKLFPRLVQVREEVHLFYGRNDDRVYVRVFESLSGLQRDGKVIDLGLKMCYPDKRELKVIRSLQSLDDVFYMYLSFPNDTNPVGSRITLAKYLSSSYSISPSSGYWKSTFGVGSSIKTNIILKEDPITEELFLSFTDTPASGPVTIQVLCIRSTGSLRYSIDSINEFEDLVQDRVLGMYVFDECLLFFGLTNAGEVKGFKARTTNGTQVDQVITTDLQFDVSDLISRPFFVDTLTPWDRIVIGSITTVQNPNDVFSNQTMKFDFLISTSQGGITVTDTEVSQFQAHLDQDDNIYSVTFVGGSEGLNLTKFDTTGNPVVQRSLTISGQSPAITGDESGLYVSYTLSVDTFVKYLGVYVAKLRPSNLSDVWNYTRLYEEESATPFQSRVRVFKDRVYTIYINNDKNILIQVNRALTGQLVGVFNTGINMGETPPTELTVEPQNDKLLYLAFPNGSNIHLIKYNIEGSGSIVWQEPNFEGSVSGVKSALILRYNPQLQNDFFAFDYDLNEVLSKAEMRDYLRSVGIVDKTDDIWDLFNLSPEDGLVYDQFAEYMYSESFRFLNRNGLYLVYTTSSATVRLAKVDQLGGQLQWSIDTEMDTLYGGRAHAFYVTNDVPLIMGVEDTSADLIANKYEPVAGELISSRRKHLITFDKDLFLSYPHIFSREIWECIWLVYPNPSEFYRARPDATEKYQNWVTLVNKALALPISEPSETFVKLSDKQAMNDCDDCLYVTYVTEEGPNNVTLSKLTYDGVTQFVKELDFGGQSPSVHVSGNKAVVAYVKKLVTFTDIVGLYVLCVRTDTFETVWKSERLLNDSFVEYFKPRVQKSDKGIHVAYFRQDGFMYIDTYDTENGALIGTPFQVSQIKTPATNNLSVIGTYVDELDVHSTECLFYGAIPNETDAQTIKMIRVDALTMSDPLVPTVLDYYESDLGNAAPKRSIQLETSKGDLYLSPEHLHLGYTEGETVVKAVQMSEDFTDTAWITQLTTDLDQVYLKQMHAMYVDGEITIVFFVRKQGSEIEVVSVKVDVYGTQFEEVIVQGPTNRSIVYSRVPLSSTFVRIGDRITITTPSPHELLENSPVILADSTIDGEYLTIPTTTFEWYNQSVTNHWRSVSWSPELSIFVAISSSGANRALYSHDGLTWFPSNTAPPASGWRSVVWSPQRGLFVAIGENRSTYSVDGVNWQTGSQPIPSGSWTSIAWSSQLGIFVAVAEGGVNRAMKSVDGVNWTLSSNAPPESAWQTIVWSSERNRFVAFANSGDDRAMSSTDGNSWTTISVGSARDWSSVTWSPNLARFVVVANGGTGRIAYSNDGTTWITSTPSGVTDQAWNFVIWVAQLNRFIVFGPSAAAQSSDGITWENMSPAVLSGTWNSAAWSPFLERLITVGTNSIMYSGEGILSFQVSDSIEGNESGTVTVINRNDYGLEELLNPSETPDTELILDHGVNPETIEEYPYVISRAPWDFAFVEYYNISRIQVLQQDFSRRLAIVGLESPGETRNGVMTPFLYTHGPIPESEVTLYQMVAIQNGDTFLAYNDTSGLKLARIRPDGSRTTILIDQYGQSPTISCFEKVEETEVYEAILLSYVRRQVGFTSMTVRINHQYRADTMQLIDDEDCRPSEYYFLDSASDIFRPRVDVSEDKVYIIYKRQDERLYIDKLDKTSNQYESMKQIREDFSDADSTGLQVRTFDENLSIVIPTSTGTSLRRFTTDLEQVWEKVFEVTQSLKIDEEEEGIFLAYKDSLSQFKVCRLEKETGDTDWTTILELPPLKGDQMHNLFVLFGYPLVFSTSVDGNMVVSKLFPSGDLASQRSTVLPSLDTDDILGLPVVLSAPPYNTVTLGYYTGREGVDDIPTGPGKGIAVEFYTGDVDHQLPIPEAETTTNQFIQLDNLVLQVHTDEPNRLLISRHDIITGNVLATRLIDDDGYPFRAIIKMSEDKVYLSYIKYEIVFTEIVEVVVREFDPETLEPLSDVVRRALPDPSPETFRPRIFILNHQLVRTYVRMDQQINFERLNLTNQFLTRPQRLGITYEDRNPDNIHFHREGSRVLFLYPTTPLEDVYRVTKINPSTLVPIWSMDMNLSAPGTPKEHPDLRFDEEFNVYYMTLSSADKGLLTKFRDQNGSVLWTKPFEVNNYRFDAVLPETSSGDNIEFSVSFGTDLQFIVNTPGSPLIFRRKSTMEILGDGVDPGQTLSNGRIIAPTQGIITFKSGFVAPGEYLYSSAFDSKMSGRVIVEPPVQDTFLWSIVNEGSFFTVTGDGAPGINLDIEVIRKDILELNILSPGYPVWIVKRTDSGDIDVTDGIENNGIEIGVIRLDTSLLSSGTYYYVTKSEPLLEGRIISSGLSLFTRSWEVTISDFRPRYYNQGMAIFENFPLIFTVPGYDAMMVHKFSDRGVLVSNRITRLTDFQYDQVSTGKSTYSASLYPWRRVLIFHDTDETPSLSYNSNRRRSARSFDSGVTQVSGPIQANVRRSQGAQDSRKTAVATFYQIDPPGWASGTSVYFFQGRRPNDLCRRLVSEIGFQPSLSKLNGEDVFYLTYIRAIETFTEVQYLNMHAISADVMLRDLWVMEEQKFIDGRWQHFRPLIKIYDEVLVIVYVRQSRLLVIETRSKENGALLQRLTTNHVVPDPEELVIGGDFDLMAGFPNGDQTITLLQFQISDTRVGIREIWSAPFVSDFGEVFRQKRSLEITQNVAENLVAAFLSSDFFPMDETEDITLQTAIQALTIEGPLTQTFYDTVDQRLLESKIDLFKTLNYIPDSRIHGRTIIMVAALLGDDILFDLIFTDAAQGMTEQNFGRHMWFFKNFGVKTEYVDRLESLPIVERRIGLEPPRMQYLYVTSIEKESKELLWTQRAQTSNFTGEFENTERIAGLAYDGAFVGVTRIGLTLVDNNPFTVDAFTYSISSTGSRVREIQDRFDENQPPAFVGTPLFMLDMADEFGIMVVILPGGELKIYRVFSTGGSVRVPFDGDGRALHPTYRGENWWRPFITINPILQGTNLEEDIILNIKDANWSSVVWTGNNFVALGPSTELERVMVSSTGKSWTGVELDSEFDKQWVDMTWAQGALNLEPYVIVALAETEDGNSVMTTTDAINWTLQETPIQDVSWASLVWDNQLLVAVGKGGTGKRVMVSGLRGFSMDSRFFTITADNSSFLISGETSGTNATIQVNRNEIVNLTINSPSSRVWISRTPNPGLETALTSGLSDNGVVGSGQVIVFNTEIVAPGTYYYVSEDVPTAIGLIIVDDVVLNKIDSDTIAGVNWEIEDVQLLGDLNSSGWRSIAWSPKLKRFVAVASTGTTRVMMSIDGFDWVEPLSLPMGLNDVEWIKVIWATTQNNGDGYYVAVASSGADIAYSPDGDTWFLRTAPQLSGMNLSSIAWSRVLNMFAVVSTNGDERISTSIDLRHWVRRGTDSEREVFEELVSRLSPEGDFITVPQMRGVLRELHFNLHEPSDVNTGSATWLSTTIDKFELPYMAYRDSSSNDLNVRKFDGNDWVSLGMNISQGDVSHVSLKTDSQERVVVAYSDSLNGGRLTVRRYSGGSWSTLGDAGFSEGSVEWVHAVIDDNDKVYVIYRDNGVGGGRLVGKKFENGIWEPMGSGPISTGTASHVSVAINDMQQIFVAFSNQVSYMDPEVVVDELVLYQYSEISESWAPSSTSLTRELSGSFEKDGNLVTISTLISNPNPPPATLPSSHGLIRGSVVIIRNSSAGLSNGLYIVHSTEDTSFTIVDSVPGNTSGTTTVVNVQGITSTTLQVELDASYTREGNSITLSFPLAHGLFPGTLLNIPVFSKAYTVVDVPTPLTLVITETSSGPSSGDVIVEYPGGSRKMEADLVNLVVNPRLNPVGVAIPGVFDKYLAYRERIIDPNGLERTPVYVKKNTDASAWFDTESSILLSDTADEMKMQGDPYGNLYLIVKEPLAESQRFSEGLTIYSYRPDTNWVKPLDRRGFAAGAVSNIDLVTTSNSPHDISDTTRIFITFSDATRSDKPTMISLYPITLQNTIVAIENMIRDASNLENDDINFREFAELNYNPPPNNWSSIIWSSGSIGPTETGSFMAVSSNSSVDRDVIVYNLPTDFSESDLRDLFTDEDYGEIEYFKIFRERSTGQTLEFGIVRFESLAGAENASQPVEQGGKNGVLVNDRTLTLERGVADRAIRSTTGITWPISKTIRDVGAGSYKAWFSNGHLKFEKRFAIEGPITGFERNYFNNGQWRKEIGHTGISNTRDFIVPTRMNLYELFRRFFVRGDDETIDKEDLLCGVRSFNLNIPRLPEGSSPLDKLFQRMSPDENGRVGFKGFSRVVATDQRTRDIVNKIGFDRAIVVRDAQTLNGLRDGILVEYESSLPAFMEIRTAIYVKDVLNGPEFTYYSDSSLKSEVLYVNGLRVGEYIEYLPREFGILKPKYIMEYDSRGYETQFKTTFYPILAAESLVESRTIRFSDPRNSNIQVLMETYWKTSPGDPIIITNGAAARSYPNHWLDLVEEETVTRVNIPVGQYTTDSLFEAVKTKLNEVSSREFNYSINNESLRATWTYATGTGRVFFRFGTVSTDVLSPNRGGLNENIGFRVSNESFQFEFIDGSLSGPLAVRNVAPIRLRARCFLTDRRAKLGPFEEYARNGELLQRGMYDNNLKVGRWETIFERPRTLMVKKAKRVLENYSKGKLSGIDALQVFDETGVRIFRKSFPIAR
jgi:antitoxin component YwqK of YwqJK toxin-antitoxin module